MTPNIPVIIQSTCIQKLIRKFIVYSVLGNSDSYKMSLYNNIKIPTEIVLIIPIASSLQVLDNKTCT